jgi:hypothetical protein
MYEVQKIVVENTLNLIEDPIRGLKNPIMKMIGFDISIHDFIQGYHYTLE